MIFQNLNYLISLITTNDARCICGIKSRIAIANAVFSKKKGSFHHQTGRKFTASTTAVSHLEHSFVWCWNLDTSGSKSETPLKSEMWCWWGWRSFRLSVWNMPEYSMRVEEERNSLHITKRKAHWIGHILRRNCLLKHAIERKIEGTGRRGRRRWMVRGQWKFILKV